MHFELSFPPRGIGRTCEVLCGKGSRSLLFERLGSEMGGRPLYVLLDAEVDRLHERTLRGFKETVKNRIRLWHPVPAGEACKDFMVLPETLRLLCRSGLTRDAVIVAFGGGATGDLAGMLASVALRGIEWVHAATTLLAMVDAGLGGKCAVNLPEGKNLCGAFHPSRILAADPDFLRTLPAEEFASGLGEIAKVALGLDRELFELLENLPPPGEPGFSEAVPEILERCLRAKAAIVSEDPYERDGGPRMKLNLGHDLGHALEGWALSRSLPLRHGTAVALGLREAIETSQEASGESKRRARALLDRLGLPRVLSDLFPDLEEPRPGDLAPFLAVDKKRRSRGSYHVEWSGPGSCEVRRLLS